MTKLFLNIMTFILVTVIYDALHNFGWFLSDTFSKFKILKIILLLKIISQKNVWEFSNQ